MADLHNYTLFLEDCMLSARVELAFTCTTGLNFRLWVLKALLNFAILEK